MGMPGEDGQREDINQKYGGLVIMAIEDKTVYTTQKQSSKLIESMLIGIPIPTVYLCQER